MSDVRSLFPITRTRAYLFAGGLAPAATPVAAAMRDWVDAWTHDTIRHRSHYFDGPDRLRAAIAGLIGADSAEVVLVDSTSRASNLAVQMLRAPAGANVVFDGTTYPSSALPWLLEPQRHVEPRMAGEPSATAPDEHLRRAVDDCTVALSVSHVDAITGFRHDLRACADLVHAHGGLLVVDGAQSVGALELDVRAAGVDVLAGTVMKWLLGPPGLGFLYARRELLEAHDPPHAGYVGVEDALQAAYGAPPRFRAGGPRHEIGLSGLPVVAAAERGIEILARAGMAEVERHVLELSGRLIAGLQDRGIDVLTPSEPERRAGVVAFRIGRPIELARFSRSRGVDVWGYEDGRVRADPHLYNTAEDVDRLLAAVDAFAARREVVA
jgi:cysteine desulfurase/selenocysteine lyase